MKKAKATPRLCLWTIDGAKLTCTCKDSNKCILKEHAEYILSELKKGKPWRKLSKVEQEKGQKDLMKELLN